MVFHLVAADEWAKAIADGFHRPASLQTEGFVHCSTGAQVVGTANRFFKGRRDLLLLEIEERLLPGPLKLEEGEPGQLFPHFYGPVPTGAVVRAEPYLPDADGVFRPRG